MRRGPRVALPLTANGKRIARAVTPGRYTMPAAQVEDMYRPGVTARTDTGTIVIAPRG